MTEPTATGWYYALNGERVGPRSLDEVRSMVATGVLDGDALVWTAGMRDWARVADFPMLSPDWAPYAPPVHAHDEPSHHAPARPDAREASATPHPWRRLSARMVDTLFYALIVTLVLGLVAPHLIPTDPQKVNPLFNLAAAALAVPMEALLLAAFGTTPGKALLRIHLTASDGERLSPGQSFSRAVQVWILGMGLGIPLLSVVTQIAALVRLATRGTAVWDDRLGLQVEYEELSTGRIVGVVGLLLVILAMVGTALSRMS